MAARRLQSCDLPAGTMLGPGMRVSMAARRLQSCDPVRRPCPEALAACFNGSAAPSELRRKRARPTATRVVVFQWQRGAFRAATCQRGFRRTSPGRFNGSAAPSELRLDARVWAVAEPAWFQWQRGAFRAATLIPRAAWRTSRWVSMAARRLQSCDTACGRGGDVYDLSFNGSAAPWELRQLGVIGTARVLVSHNGSAAPWELRPLGGGRTSRRRGPVTMAAQCLGNCDLLGPRALRRHARRVTMAAQWAQRHKWQRPSRRSRGRSAFRRWASRDDKKPLGLAQPAP